VSKGVWKVRFVDYPTQFQKMGNEIMGVIRNVLAQGDLILRQQLREFEEHLAHFIGAKYAVGVSNGTDALHLALRAVGIGREHEVITVSHTFVATAAAVHHAGATPVLIDIDDDHNMNVDLVEAAITSRTKAIMPVHLNGRLCDMERLTHIAKKHKLLVIEDAAQALGASFQGTKAGAFGVASCFSFYPAKLLGGFGDGGAVVTNSKEIADRIRRLRHHGLTEEGEVSCWAFNCRLDNLQAAILDLKLVQLPSWITRRREIALLYQKRLSGIAQLRLPPPPTDGPFFDVYQNYEIEAENRDHLVAHLKESGVEVLVQFGGNAVHQFKALGLAHFVLPRTELMTKRALMLPMHPELSNDQVEYVARTIEAFYSDQKAG